MKIKIAHIECGGFGSIIDCNAPRIFCPFCKERVADFSEVKEVTPMELYELLKCNYNKIISVVLTTPPKKGVSTAYP
jgi:hypothetical protein